MATSLHLGNCPPRETALLNTQKNPRIHKTKPPPRLHTHFHTNTGQQAAHALCCPHLHTHPHIPDGNIIASSRDVFLCCCTGAQLHQTPHAAAAAAACRKLSVTHGVATAAVIVTYNQIRYTVAAAFAAAGVGRHLSAAPAPNLPQAETVRLPNWLLPWCRCAPQNAAAAAAAPLAGGQPPKLQLQLLFSA